MMHMRSNEDIREPPSIARWRAHQRPRAHIPGTFPRPEQNATLSILPQEPWWEQEDPKACAHLALEPQPPRHPNDAPPRREETRHVEIQRKNELLAMEVANRKKVLDRVPKRTPLPGDER
jgi:hypothetical protein